MLASSRARVKASLSPARTACLRALTGGLSTMMTATAPGRSSTMLDKAFSFLPGHVGPGRSSLASPSDRAFAVVLALWSLLRLSLRRRILSGELRARFRPIGRRFDLGRTQRSCISPWLILRRRTQIFWIALWHEFV